VWGAKVGLSVSSNDYLGSGTGWGNFQYSLSVLGAEASSRLLDSKTS